MSLPQPARGSSPGGRTVRGDVLRAVLSELVGSFCGRLLTPESDECDTSRRIWNAMIDAHPGQYLEREAFTAVPRSMGSRAGSSTRPTTGWSR